MMTGSDEHGSRLQFRLRVTHSIEANGRAAQLVGAIHLADFIGNGHAGYY